MRELPRPPGLRPGGAAEVKDGQEHRLFDTSAAKSQALACLHRQRQVDRIHRLGARVVCELLDEIARHHGLGDDLDRRLERYAAVEPRIVAAVGADRFPASPLRAVGVGR